MANDEASWPYSDGVREVIVRALEQLQGELDPARVSALRRLAAENKLGADAVLAVLEGATATDGD